VFSNVNVCYGHQSNVYASSPRIFTQCHSLHQYDPAVGGRSFAELPRHHLLHFKQPTVVERVACNDQSGDVVGLRHVQRSIHLDVHHEYVVGVQYRCGQFNSFLFHVSIFGGQFNGRTLDVWLAGLFLLESKLAARRCNEKTGRGVVFDLFICLFAHVYDLWDGQCCATIVGRLVHEWDTFSMPHDKLRWGWCGFGGGGRGGV
jgi:hypothetical protein